MGARQSNLSDTESPPVTVPQSRDQRYMMIQELDCISSDLFQLRDEEVRAPQLPVDIEDDLVIFMLCDDEKSFREALARHGNTDGMFSADVCVATACWRDSSGKYLRILLDSGLDPNAKIPRLAVRDTFPTTMAVNECRLEISIEEHTKRETNKRAVHLAAGAGNIGALRELLGRTGTEYNVEDSHGNTALHYVSCARYRDKANKGRFDECTQQLMDMPEINVNVVNKDDLTPVQMAARCGNFVVLKVLLGHKKVKTIPKDSNKNTLLHKLSENPDAAIGNNELIELCVILLLSRKGIDINARNNRGNTALHLAARFANLAVLKTLMKYSETDVFAVGSQGRNLLHFAAECWFVTVEDAERAKVCLNFLLDWRDASTSEALDVNQKEKRGYTPAHLALVSKNQDGALTLLRRGSNIWETCNNGRYLLDDIAPDTLEEFLDSCLDHSGEPHKRSYTVYFKYLFVPPATCNSSGGIEGEMRVIEHISSKKHLRHLILHPIIRSFLNLKYHRLRLPFYFNIWLYTVFVLCLSAYLSVEMVRVESGVSESNVIRNVLMIVTSILMGIMLLREIIQIFILRWRYISLENILEVIIFLFTSVVIAVDGSIEGDMRHMCVLLVFLSWMELVLLTGRLPLWSVQYEMLKTVLFTFLRYFCWFLLIIIGFSMCFHVLFYGGEHDQTFVMPWFSLVRTIVLATGEYEFKDLPLELLSGTSHVVLVVFVLIVSLAMLNLLNGLAVSDTQAIKEKALFLSVVSTIRLIMLFEDIYVSTNSTVFYPTSPSTSHFKFFALFPEATSRDDTCFEVMPNLKVTGTPLHSNLNWECIAREVRLWFRHVLRWIKGSDMDSDIVQSAMDILNRRHETLCLETIKRQFDDKINEYEIKLASLGRKVEENSTAVEDLGTKTSAALCRMEREMQNSCAEILLLLRTLHEDHSNLTNNIALHI
ncbi:transient receptor potential channel pyrexia-like [Bacillus rossius redtenbacheri]|uniref:transient receptor potential channel pyrexia-like n=1 Tax=Bacillus rossius redtenbacheri TaxID=93214 RepID=UPI002FDD3001